MRSLVTSHNVLMRLGAQRIRDLDEEVLRLRREICNLQVDFRESSNRIQEFSALLAKRDQDCRDQEAARARETINHWKRESQIKAARVIITNLLENVKVWDTKKKATDWLEKTSEVSD